MNVIGLFTGVSEMDHDIRTVRKVLRGEIDCFEELILRYESMVEAMELREIMKSGLHSLDRKNAEIFLNRVKHNMTFKEIAKKAGITPVAARIRFSRTRKMLKGAAQKIARRRVIA